MPNAVCKFEYDFFISYPHMNENQLPHLVTDFADTLASKLSFIRQYTDTKTAFIDKNRLKPGFRWAPALAQALCRSRCLILVYNEQYFAREYCLLEYRAMCALELQRSGSPTNAMIIPVIVQCPGDINEKPVLPPEVVQFQWFDFRSLLPLGIFFNTKKCREKVQAISKRIEDLRRLCPNPVLDCGGYTFNAAVHPKPEPIEAFAGAWIPPGSPPAPPGVHV